jgi:hypothetical protein
MGFAVFAEDFWTFGAELSWDDLVRRLHSTYGSEYLPQSEARWESIRRRLESRGSVSREAFVDFCSGPVGVAVLEAFATAPGEELACSQGQSRSGSSESDIPPPAFGRAVRSTKALQRAGSADAGRRAEIAAALDRQDEEHDGDVTFRSPSSDVVSEEDDVQLASFGTRAKTSLSAHGSNDASERIEAEGRREALADFGATRGLAEVRQELDYRADADARGSRPYTSDESRSSLRPGTSEVDRRPSPFGGPGQDAENRNTRQLGARPDVDKKETEEVVTRDGSRFKTERSQLMLEVTSSGKTLSVSWPASMWPSGDSRLLLYRCTCDPHTGARHSDTLVEVEMPPRTTHFEDKSVEEQQLYGYLLLSITEGPVRAFCVSRTVFAHL